MLTLDDVLTIEEDEDATAAEEIEALQRAISGGTWSLQGSWGRAMMDAIEAGVCVLGPRGARDYWGNYIPSRTEVKSGTKGSIAYANAQGTRQRLGLPMINGSYLRRVER
jgi:hypothetical protein